MQELDEVLTREMAHQKVQALIKGDSLEAIAGAIVRLAAELDSQQNLTAAAMLGRLAAVARGREKTVFDHVRLLRLSEDAHIELLPNRDYKTYAAQAVSHVDAIWVADYCAREAVGIDAADIARRELLSISLARYDSVELWLRKVSELSTVLLEIENVDSRLIRSKRIFTSLFEVLQEFHGNLGSNPGQALGLCLQRYLSSGSDKIDQSALHDLLDQALGSIVRLIEMKFSYALTASTYAAISEGRKGLGVLRWKEYLRASKSIGAVRNDLLETALVLARQNRTDREIADHMSTAFESRQQLKIAAERHFVGAGDVPPNLRQWWVSGGAVAEGDRQVEQKVGNNEDEQIGALLLEVEANSGVMDKLDRAVAPLLEISDPVLASTVRKAAKGHIAIAQVARRLARMRRLTTMDLQGSRIDYNPIEHEMLGGHVSGVRRVKVVRDGIQKDFGGRLKTFVKPWVEPDPT
ncbi:hypothetical protein EEB15_29950 [Ramlibacter sp. WS9]|nr:hypothetical protein EEB15_29950 [Ramlibacter sp. WS9]